jgi:hypothetical protein
MLVSLYFSVLKHCMGDLFLLNLKRKEVQVAYY